MKVKKTTLKYISTFALCIIALSAFLIAGCGGDQTATQNWKITVLSSELGAPSLAAGTSCYPDVTFLITDPAGNAANGINVFLYTGANSGLAVGTNTCAIATNSSVTAQSENDGTVVVSLSVTPVAVGDTFFIHASSGAATPVLLVSKATTT